DPIQVGAVQELIQVLPAGLHRREGDAAGHTGDIRTDVGRIPESVDVLLLDVPCEPVPIRGDDPDRQEPEGLEVDGLLVRPRQGLGQVNRHRRHQANGPLHLPDQSTAVVLGLELRERRHSKIPFLEGIWLVAHYGAGCCPSVVYWGRCVTRNTTRAWFTSPPGKGTSCGVTSTRNSSTYPACRSCGLPLLTSRSLMASAMRTASVPGAYTSTVSRSVRSQSPRFPPVVYSATDALSSPTSR